MIKVWEWIKKYWKWLIFPVGVVLFFIGQLTARRSSVVIQSEIAEAEKWQQKAREEAEARAREAELERKKQVEELEKKHEDTIKQLTDDQRSQVERLRDHPEKLSEYLLRVGKDIRG